MFPQGTIIDVITNSPSTLGLVQPLLENDDGDMRFKIHQDHLQRRNHNMSLSLAIVVNFTLNNDEIVHTFLDFVLGSHIIFPKWFPLS